MNNKYYTPKIEEFHFGFEYEVNEMAQKPTGNNQDRWIPTIWGNDDIYFLSQSLPNGDWARVKYLDMEDLAELGFELIHFGLIGMDGKKDMDAAQFVLNNGRCFVHLELTRFSSWIVLRIDTSVSKNSVQTNIVHSITINNKSELKVLMQQLNIL